MTAIQKARDALDEALRQLDINVSIARRDHPEGPFIDGKRLNIDALPHSQDILASHVKDRIREALAALDAETEVKVRELEWSDEPKDGGDPTGRREGDAFVVWTTDGSLYRLKERRATDRTSYSCTIWRADTPISSHGDFREAKAAAQADFERRIRSALVPSESRS